MRLGPGAFGVLLLAGVAAAQQPEELGPGPAWRGPRRPTAHNEVFATGDGCAMCHSNADGANALRSATGEDVAPYDLWVGSVMAQSFRDPYWRATVQKEIAADPASGDDVQALCTRCHAPMVHHSRRLAGLGPRPVAAMVEDPLARDGVSCTVCHQIPADGLGTEISLDGKLRIGKDRVIYGPFAEPSGMPMRNMARYEPTHGQHVQQAALCGSCHTLRTAHAGAEFPEQTPFFEWRNSVFSDERGRTAESRTCQECHMPDVGRMRIARNPMGRDFAIAPREPVRGHGFVGGNAFLLDLLAANREALGVLAPVESLQKTARATRRQLAVDTIALSVAPIVRENGELRFSVRIENRTGHKFPTGYPARRAWLHVQVRGGGETWFESGGFTSDGRIAGIADPLHVPHPARISSPDQVAVYELVAHDEHGVPTTHLTKMSQRGKDTRLLPKGWRADGPHAAETSPVGIAGDADFGAGGDTVAFAIPCGEHPAAATVVAWVHYQTIPPHWADALRGVEAPECKAFVQMYDAADKTPETVGVVVRNEGND